MKIFYLRDNAKRPIALVVSELGVDEKYVYFAMATWRADGWVPDVYNKALALRIALDRLHNGGRFRGRVERGDSQERGQVKDRILRAVVNTTEPERFPERSRRAAELWLNGVRPTTASNAKRNQRWAQRQGEPQLRSNQTRPH